MRLLLPIALPAVLGLLAWLLRSARTQLAFLLGGAALHVAVVAWLFAAPAAPLGVLALDELGRLFLSLTSVVFALAALYTVSYLRDGTHDAPARPHRLVPALLWFLAAMSLVTLTHHLAVLWAAVEATTLATAPLIAFYRRRPALEATWKYLLLCSVGIALALLGTFCLGIAASGVPGGATLTLDTLVQAARAGAMARPWLEAAFVLALVGYGTKMGLAPLHTWLPDAHSQAPSPVSALLSGVVLNGAFLGILRFHQVVVASGDAAFAQALLVLLGFASIALATAFMVKQRDYKRLLAYSSVENMGVLAVGVGVGGTAAFGALLHAVNHSLAKAGLFLLAGNVLRAYGTTAAGEVRGVRRRLPATGALLLLLALAIGGLPPFGPFMSEFLVFEAALRGPTPWLGVAFAGLLAVAFLGLAGVLVPMLQPGAAAPGGDGAPRARERLLSVLSPALVAGAVLVLGLGLPPFLKELLGAAASSIGGAP
ncbi:MAG TPA: proton-conducting transporter membrane subunit [Anaeromyxobacter sp.]|nr:proton-conducting transporter membrane subunit [Anaeromyxobacter sp.]